MLRPAVQPSRRFRMPLILTAMGAAATVLAACADDAVPPPCPPVSFVSGLERATQFVPGQGTDLTEVTYDGRLESLSAGCDFRKEGVRMVVSFNVVATRGAAATDRLARIPFFVAITDQNGEILEKEIFESEIPFEGNARRVGRVEEIEPYIPYPIEPVLDGYRVLIGFQLDEKQLEYNRTRRR